MSEFNFAADGTPIVPGYNDTDLEIAYTTTDENDAILTKPPAGKSWNIVDGRPVLVDNEVTLQDLYRLNSMLKDQTLSNGITVTGKYIVAGNEVNTSKRIYMDTDVKVNIMAICMGLSMKETAGIEYDPVKLKVGDGVMLVISSLSQASQLLEAGTLFNYEVFTLEEECRTTIADGSSATYQAIARNIRVKWRSLRYSATLV